MSFKPKTLDFGNKTKVGKTGKKELTIKNTDSKKSEIGVTITGETTAAPFAVKKQCAKKLKPGKSCKVEVTFDGHHPAVGRADCQRRRDGRAADDPTVGYREVTAGRSATATSATKAAGQMARRFVFSISTRE